VDTGISPCCGGIHWPAALTKSIKSLEEFGLRSRPAFSTNRSTPFARSWLIDHGDSLQSQQIKGGRPFKGISVSELMVGCDPMLLKAWLPLLWRDWSILPETALWGEVAGAILKEKLLNRQIDLHVGALQMYDARVSTIEFALPPVVYFCRSGHPWHVRGDCF